MKQCLQALLLLFVFANGGWIAQENDISEIMELYKKRDTNSLRVAILKIEEATKTLEKGDGNNEKIDHRFLALESLIYSHLNQLETMLSPNLDDYFIKSLEIAKKAVSIKKDELSLLALSKAYLVNNDYAAALKTAQEGIDMSPENSELWYVAACASPGNISDATSQAGQKIEKAISLDPGFVWPMEDIVQDAIHNNNQKVAEKYLKKIERNASNYKRIKFHKGLMLYHFGKRKEGLTLLQDYIEEDKDSIHAEKIRQLLSNIQN